MRNYKLISKIWDKEQMLKDWLHGVICPAYSKGAITEELHY
jgi:hypothetical protein